VAAGSILITEDDLDVGRSNLGRRSMDGLLQKSLMAAAALAIGVGAWISGARAAEVAPAVVQTQATILEIPAPVPIVPDPLAGIR
jgi:hypothetical protein